MELFQNMLKKYRHDLGGLMEEEFLRFIRSKRYELETGWYLLDRTIYPNFDSTKSSLQLDELADRVRDLLTMPLVRVKLVW